MNTHPHEKKIEVSATAKVVLAIKEFYNTPNWPGARKKPLYSGTHKQLFLSEADMESVKLRAEPPEVLQSLAVRERWFNKICRAAIKKENIQQIIILGSGFDTRPYKLNPANQQGKPHEKVYSQVKFFEVDCAENLDTKEAIFADNGIDKNAVYVRADYTDPDFMDKLQSHGVKVDSPTLIIWEGNSMYLQLKQIKKLFLNLQTSFNNVVIAFDYFSRTFIQGPPSCFALHRMGMWKTGLNEDDLKELAIKCHLTVVSTESIAELEQHYQVNNQPPSESHQYHCAVLKKA